MIKMEWIARFTVPQSVIDEVGGTKMSAAFFNSHLKPYVDELISAEINRRPPDASEAWQQLHSLVNTYEFQDIDVVEFVVEG